MPWRRPRGFDQRLNLSRWLSRLPAPRPGLSTVLPVGWARRLVIVSRARRSVKPCSVTLVPVKCRSVAHASPLSQHRCHRPCTCAHITSTHMLLKRSHCVCVGHDAYLRGGISHQIAAQQVRTHRKLTLPCNRSQNRPCRLPQRCHQRVHTPTLP